MSWMLVRKAVCYRLKGLDYSGGMTKDESCQQGREIMAWKLPQKSKRMQVPLAVLISECPWWNARVSSGKKEQVAFVDKEEECRRAWLSHSKESGGHSGNVVEEGSHGKTGWGEEAQSSVRTWEITAARQLSKTTEVVAKLVSWKKALLLWLWTL